MKPCRDERLKAILNNSTAVVYLKDLDGRYLFINRQFERLFNISDSNIAGKTDHDIFPKEVADTLRKHDLNVLKQNSSVEIEEVVPHGDVIHTYISIKFPLADAEGQAYAVCGISTDITERIEAEAEKDALEREVMHASKLQAVGQLAGGIAHEINTPAQYVGDNLGFLNNSLKDLTKVLEAHGRLASTVKQAESFGAEISEVEEASKDVDMDFLLSEIPAAIEEAIDGNAQVARIVRAMKEFSHPGTEDKTTVNLGAALKTTITVSRNEWKYVAELDTDFDAELPSEPCHPGEINQVFLNLIVNAAHAIDDKVGSDGGKGHITISTRQDGDWAEIRIADSGVGIPELIREKVFEPFFTTKQVGKGTGQGLSISYDIVTRKHGGEIFFETEPDKGTTFVIRLPIKDAAGAHVDQSQNDQPSAP